MLMPLTSEHSAATAVLQRTHFWAVLFSSVHAIPTAFTSASVDLLQFCLELPTFLLPSGFQSDACRVTLDDDFLNVRPIHAIFSSWCRVGLGLGWFFPTDLHLISPPAIWCWRCWGDICWQTFVDCSCWSWLCATSPIWEAWLILHLCWVFWACSWGKELMIAIWAWVFERHVSLCWWDSWCRRVIIRPCSLGWPLW